MNLFKRVQRLEERLDAAKRAGVQTGTVVGNDTANKTVTMTVINPDGTAKNMVFPVATNYIPEAGSKAVITMNGTNPMVIPLQGQTVAADGSWLRSPDYVAGVSGWKIDADGSAEFNNVVIRGVLEAAVIDRLDATSFQVSSSLYTTFTSPPNLNFDVNATGWAGLTNCSVARVTTPVQAGAGALAITVTGAGAWAAGTPTGTSGVACLPGVQYQVQYWARTAATVRNVRMYVRFYNAAGSLITTWKGGDEGDTAGFNDSTTYATRTSYATAPPNAAYYSLRFAGTAGAAAEIHYLDSISMAIGAGFCADACYIGPTFRESIGGNYSLPNGYVGTESNGAGSQVQAATEWANFGATLAVTPGQAYSVEADAVFGDIAMAVRTYAAWYTSAGALIRTDYGAILYTDSVADPSPPIAGEFVAPGDAAYVFAGIGVFGGITSTATTHAVSVGTLSLYKTTNVSSGYLAPEVSFSNADSCPPGMCMAYAGKISNVSTVEQPIPGWLVCDGRAVSRTRWVELFASIGTTYGVGDGSTTFNLPDIRGRVPFGSDTQGGSAGNRINAYGSALGTAGGEDAHTLVIGETPVHAHNIGGASGPAGALGGLYGGTGAGQASGFQGGGGSHENMPPFITMYWLIKT